MEKSKQQTVLIATGTLSRHGATLAYFGIYLASLRYVLPQCHFRHDQLDKAEMKTISTILAKCGFNRHTPKPIRYAPQSYAGCGMIPWWVTQAEGQISLFIKHWRTDTVISKTLRVATAWGQWLTGLSRSFLFDVSTPLPHFEAKWLNSLRNALDRANMQLHLNKSYVLPAERTNDIHIMEWASLYSELSPKAIKVLNYCRLYLHVTTISELFDSDGLRILSYMYECRRPPWFNKRQFMPIQTRPSPYQIRKVWKPFCNRWIQKIGLLQSHPLGHWTHQAAHYRPYRRSYVECHREPHLYEPTYYTWFIDSYWEMILIPTDSPHWILLSLRHPTTWRPTSTSAPTHLIPTGFLNTRRTFRCATLPAQHQPLPMAHLSPPLPLQYPITDTPFSDTIATVTTSNHSYTSPDFHTHVTKLPPWESLLLQHVHFGSNTSHLLPLLHRLYRSPGQRLIAVVQNWYQDNTASFGWLLFSTNGDSIAASHGPSPGPPSRSRADAWGVLSLLRFLYHLPKSLSHEILFPPVTILHRNTRIIRIMRSRPTWHTVYCNETISPNWDILEQCFVSTQDLDIQITWQTLMDFKLENHRLDFSPLFSFDSRIDHLKTHTKEYLGKYYQRIDYSPFLPSSSCMLISTTGTIHEHYHSAYREAVNVTALHQYLSSKHGWSPLTLSDINWQWFQKATSLYRHASANHLTKLIYDQLPTPARLQKQGGKRWISATCPHCQSESLETFDHMLRCDHPAAIQFRMLLPKAVSNHCTSYRAPSAVQYTLLTAIDFALGATYSHQPETSSSSSASTPLNSQNSIGWSPFLRGFLSHKWRRYLTDHMRLRPKPSLRCSPDQFLYKLILIFWTAQTDFWKSYQDLRHTSSPTATTPSPKHLETRQDVQYLLSLKKQVCPEHQAAYFPSDPLHFLASGTTTQFRTYIFNYSDAIKQSIIEANRRSVASTRPLWTFGGFTRAPPPPTQPPDTTTQPSQPLRRISPPPPVRRIQHSIITWIKRRLTPPNPLGPTNEQPTMMSTTSKTPALPGTPFPTYSPPLSSSLSTTPVPPHHKHSRWKRSS